MILKWLPESWKESLRRRAGAVTLRARLENLRRAGFSPRQIIDAGAYRGEWASMIHSIFPTAAILLIEPQPLLAPRLREVCSRMQAARFRPALLGAKSKMVRFLLGESNSYVVSDSYCMRPSEKVIEMRMETLATVAEAEGFGKCDLLKLDLQGHELEAMAGAGDMFGQVEVIVTEVSWLRIGDVPLAHEVWDAFQQRGYRLYDVFGFNYRPLDGALWQTDFIFVRQDSRLIADLRWA